MAESPNAAGDDKAERDTDESVDLFGPQDSD